MDRRAHRCPRAHRVSDLASPPHALPAVSGSDDRAGHPGYNLWLDAVGVLLLLAAVLAAPTIRAAWPESRDTIALVGAGLGAVVALVLFTRWRHR